MRNNGSEGEEVHHLVHQSEADESGYVGSFHKNHPMVQNVCENVTINYTKQENNCLKTKTSNGNYILTATTRR